MWTFPGKPHASLIDLFAISKEKEKVRANLMLFGFTCSVSVSILTFGSYLLAAVASGSLMKTKKKRFLVEIRVGSM